MKEWLTARESALVIGRHVSRVYAWIAQGKVTTRVDEHGVTLVRHGSLTKAEESTRLGRPKGSPTRRAG